MQTQPPRVWLIASVTLLCGVSIGYYAGRSGEGDEAARAEAKDAGSTRGADSQNDPPPPGPEYEGIAEGLARAKTPGERLALILRQPSGRWRARQIALLADEIPAREIPAFLARLAADSASDTQEISEAILRCWAEVDPAAAAAHALTMDQFLRWQGLNATVGEWVAQDAAGAATWVRNLPPGGDRNAAASAVVRALSRRDPEGAFRMMMELDAPENQLHDVQEVMARWAAKDPASAVAALSELKPPSVASRGHLNVARGWAMADPAAAFTWSTTVLGREHRNAAITAIVRSWMDRDAETALRTITAMPDGLERQFALGSAAQSIVVTDPDRALALLAQLPDGAAHHFAIGQVARTLARQDPGRAAEVVIGLSPGLADGAIEEIVPRLMAADPAKAADLALRVIDAPSRGRLVANHFREWMRSKPDDAMAWLQTRKLDAHAEVQVADLLKTWAAENVESAAATLRNGGAGNSSALWNGMLPGIATKDPRIAADLVLGRKDNAYSSNTLLNVGQAFAVSDPAASAAWLLRLPDGDGRAAAATGVAMGWAGANPQASAAWIETLPAGKTRDGAAIGYARQVARIDPAGSLAWAATVNASPLRDELMSQTLAGWLYKDADAANAWIATNPNLPERVRAVVEKARAAER